eukprot:s3115_g15.t1
MLEVVLVAKVMTSASDDAEVVKRFPLELDVEGKERPAFVWERGNHRDYLTGDGGGHETGMAHEIAAHHEVAVRRRHYGGMV